MTSVAETLSPADAAGKSVQKRRLPAAQLGARGWVEQVVVLAVAFLVWELVTAGLQSFFFPRPSAIVARAYENWFSGPASHFFLTEQVRSDVLPSLARMAAGWAIAVVAGVGLGTLLGVYRRASEFVDPVIHFMRSAPGPALLPVFLLIFGIGNSMKIAFVAFGTVWPILLNTRDGVRSVEPTQLEAATVFRVEGIDRIRRVILPAAMPKIVAGLRISLAIALVLMVVSDMLASTGGFGFGLIRAQREFRMLDLWASILLLSVIGYAINATFLRIERRRMAWHYAYRRRGGQ